MTNFTIEYTSQKIPTGTTELTIQYYRHSTIHKIPNTVRKLTLRSIWTTQLQFTLPVGLKELRIINTDLESLPVLPEGLETLVCEKNINLKELAELPSSLRRLDCNENRNLMSLPTLPTNLVNLICCDNQLTELPVLPTELANLTCSGNPLTTLPVLPENLWSLTCENTNISSIPPLPRRLGTLRVGCNKNLSSLPDLPSTVRKLLCGDCNLSKLPDLPDSVFLLYCQNNRLTELPKLPSRIQTCDFRNNKITTVPALPDKFGRMDFSRNPIRHFERFSDIAVVKINIAVKIRGISKKILMKPYMKMHVARVIDKHCSEQIVRWRDAPVAKDGRLGLACRVGLRNVCGYEGFYPPE